jgi:hypothetical protein
MGSNAEPRQGVPAAAAAFALCRCCITKRLCVRFTACVTHGELGSTPHLGLSSTHTVGAAACGWSLG